jgi:CO/xanthine dehydrogenase Mo-binding subunit
MSFLQPLRRQPRKMVSVVGRKRQEVGQNCHVVCVTGGLGEQVFKLRELLRGRVAAFKPGSTFKLANKREQSTITMLRRAEVMEWDVWFRRDTLFKREGDVRLADARLSRKHHNPAFTLNGIPPSAREKRDLFLAPYQRRQLGPVPRLKAALDSARSYIAQ